MGVGNMKITHAVSRQGLGAALVTLVALLLTWQVSAGAQELERTELKILAEGEQHSLQVELAQTAAERRNGLMGRDVLDPDAGMLFVYQDPQPPQSSFWMYRTLIPLDIAFIDNQGRIVALYTMQPCTSSNPADCPATVASVTYRVALEVNGGYFEAHGIEVGACVTWPGRIAGCASGPNVE